MSCINSKKIGVYLPFAGGSAYSFEALRHSVNQYFPFVGMTYKGRDTGERGTAWNVDAMADEVIDFINTLGAEEVILFGYSLGALVAYEVARRKPLVEPLLSQVVVAACRSPGRFNCEHVILTGSDDTFLHSVARFGMIPDFMFNNAAARRYLLPPIIKDFNAAANYRHIEGEQLDVPLIAVGGLDDPFAPVGDVSAWGDTTRNSFRAEFFTGRHFFLHDHVPAMTRLLTGLGPRAVSAQAFPPHPGASTLH